MTQAGFKVTPRVKQILRTMKRGGFIWWMDSLSQTSEVPFLCHRKSASRMTRPMVMNLYKVGYIQGDKPHCAWWDMHGSYTITDKGKAVLQKGGQR